MCLGGCYPPTSCRTNLSCSSAPSSWPTRRTPPASAARLPLSPAASNPPLTTTLARLAPVLHPPVPQPPPQLLFAFQTPTGLPFGTVGLRSRTRHNPTWSKGASTVAEVATLQLEFRVLSEAHEQRGFRGRRPARDAPPAADAVARRPPARAVPDLHLSDDRRLCVGGTHSGRALWAGSNPLSHVPAEDPTPLPQAHVLTPCTSTCSNSGC